MKAIELLTPEIIALISEHNACDQLNTFLYKHDECNKLFAELTNGKDRWQLVIRINQIERLLIEPIHALFHNKEVIITETGVRKQRAEKKTVTARIIHNKTREYNNQILDNSVSFRTDDNGNETIALWVDTGDKYSTHLYNIDLIELVENDDIARAHHMSTMPD